MGMSASQARFLLLTAQKSDVEFQSQQVCQQRLQLAQQHDEAVKEFSEKTNNRVLLFKKYADSDAKSQRLTYNTIVAEAPEGLGLRLVNGASGKITVPQMPNPLPDGTKETDYFVDPNVANGDLLEAGLRDGTYFVQRIVDNEYQNVGVTTLPGVSDDYYELDDSAAENKFKVQQTSFQTDDKKLELQLKQLDTQHKSIETEMDSVKKVVEKNVETTFKTFG